MYTSLKLQKLLDLKFIYDINTNQIYTDSSINDIYTFLVVMAGKKTLKYISSVITKGHYDFLYAVLQDKQLVISTNLDPCEVQMLFQGLNLFTKKQLLEFMHPFKEYYHVL